MFWMEQMMDTALLLHQDELIFKADVKEADNNLRLRQHDQTYLAFPVNGAV